MTQKSLSRDKDASTGTIMANYNGSLEAVDCHIHSVRYYMVLERELTAVLDASSGQRDFNSLLLSLFVCARVRYMTNIF